jgi:hypothetical protein
LIIFQEMFIWIYAVTGYATKCCLVKPVFLFKLNRLRSLAYFLSYRCKDCVDKLLVQGCMHFSHAKVLAIDFNYYSFKDLLNVSRL